MRLARRLRSDEGGATAVEFAIIAIPLLMMLLGSIEFGRMIWVRQSASQVAAMTARCMGVPQSECAALGARDVAKSQTFAVNLASRWGLKISGANLAFETAATCGGATGFSRVTVTYRFVSAAPLLIKQLADNPITVSACFPNGAS